MTEKPEPKMITWEPSIHVPGIGVIKLTIEQVRAILKERGTLISK